MKIKSGVVFAYAFVISIETILVESLTTALQISPLTIAANSIPLAGGMLLFIATLRMKDKITIFKSWRHLLPGSAFMALGIITWYDSVSRIGASKESTLTGPLETTVVLFLAWFFLKGTTKQGTTHRIFDRNHWDFCSCYEWKHIRGILVIIFV